MRVEGTLGSPVDCRPWGDTCSGCPQSSIILLVCVCVCVCVCVREREREIERVCVCVCVVVVLRSRHVKNNSLIILMRERPFRGLTHKRKGRNLAATV